MPVASYKSGVFQKFEPKYNFASKTDATREELKVVERYLNSEVCTAVENSHNENALYECVAVALNQTNERKPMTGKEVRQKVFKYISGHRDAFITQFCLSLNDMVKVLANFTKPDMRPAKLHVAAIVCSLNISLTVVEKTIAMINKPQDFQYLPLEKKPPASCDIKLVYIKTAEHYMNVQFASLSQMTDFVRKQKTFKGVSVPL